MLCGFADRVAEAAAVIESNRLQRKGPWVVRRCIRATGGICCSDMTGRNTFTRAERLSGKSAFDRVFQGGRAFRRRPLTVIVRTNDAGVSRLGLSVGRKLGGAVRRNRIKRVLREAFRLNKGLLAANCDLVVIPRRDWKEISLASVEESFRRILREIGEAFGGGGAGDAS